MSYDDASRSTVTLAGSGGTRLTNLAAGRVTATSSDATTGAQLHAALSSAADVIGGGATVTAFGTISAPAYSIGGANLDVAKIHHRLDVAAYLVESLVGDGKLIVPDREVPLCVFGVKA